MASRVPPDDPGNSPRPFATAKVGVGTAERPSWPSQIPFDLGCIIEATWSVYLQRPGTCIGLCGTVLVLTVATPLVPLRWLISAAGPRGPWTLFLARFGILFVGCIFGTWLGLGERLALLALLRREAGAVGWLFRGGRHLLTALLAGALLVLSLAVIALTCASVGVAAGRMLEPVLPVRMQVDAVAMSLALALAGYVAVRCSQFAYVIVDRDAGALEALGASWQVTRSRVVSLILVYLLWLTINVAGLAAYGVGVFLTVPFTSLMLAVTYLSLRGVPLDGDGTNPEVDVP